MPTIVDPTLRPFYAAVYEAIREAWVDYGIAPSQQELRLACRTSTTTVIKAIRELRKRGYIVAPKFGQRAVKPTDVDRIILYREPDPWADLEPPKKYWKPAPDKGKIPRANQRYI